MFGAVSVVQVLGPPAGAIRLPNCWLHNLSLVEFVRARYNYPSDKLRTHYIYIAVGGKFFKDLISLYDCICTYQYIVEMRKF